MPVFLLRVCVCAYLIALRAFFHGGAEICGSLEKTMRRRQVLLDTMNERYEQDNALWAYVRSRLEVLLMLLLYYW